jgi:hypothetical protein
VVTRSDSSEDEDPGPVCGASPFEKKVTEQLARETAAFASRTAFARKIPVYEWAAAGSRRGPDRKSVRMYLLRSALAGANRLTEDAHGDIIGLSDAAPSSSRAADAPTQSRTAACCCPHGSTGDGGKNEEFRLLEIVDAQGNAAPKNGNRSRLFTGVREPFDPRVPNFTCKFISTSLVPHGKNKAIFQRTGSSRDQPNGRGKAGPRRAHVPAPEISMMMTELVPSHAGPEISLLE